MSKHKNKQAKKSPVILEDVLENSIYKTLTYRAIFEYPLTLHQLGTFLISKKPYTLEELKNALNAMFQKGVIEIKNNTYHLPKQPIVSWNTRTKDSKILMEKAQEACNILGQIPWVQMVGVTGSVASYNASKTDDIDIFIVAKKGRVWITRCFCVLILKLLDIYRTDQDFAGKICPNIFIDETNLEWNKNAQNVYVAHEIAMMHPIVNKNNTYFKFMSKNAWISEHFGIYRDYPSIPVKLKDGSKLVDLIEWIFYKMQVNYMKKRKTTEVTQHNLIHFNKKDWSKQILREYKP